MVSQRELARLLNLSAATISKSLKQSSDINAHTQARVLEAASRLGYRVPVRKVARRSSNSEAIRFIGVVIYDNPSKPDLDLPAIGYLAGMSEVAATQDVSLVIHRYKGDPAKILYKPSQPAAMRENMLQGLVLIHRIREDVVKQLAAMCPCVTLTHHVPQAQADHVDADHITAMHQLVGRLFEAGHRRIGFIGRSAKLSYTLAHYGSYTHAMARYGLRPELDRTLNIFEPLDLEACIDRAALAVGQVTAWVCGSDFVAQHLIGGLIKRGIEVPGDVSVTGFDAIEFDSDLPKLTSIRTPFEEMGMAAFHRLMERIERPSLPTRLTLLHCQMVEGSTVGPPRTE